MCQLPKICIDMRQVGIGFVAMFCHPSSYPVQCAMNVLYSSILSKLVIQVVLQNVLSGLLDSEVELLSWNSFQLEYADDVALLSNNANAIQSALDHLAIEISRNGMCFALPKFEVFFFKTGRSLCLHSPFLLID